MRLLRRVPLPLVITLAVVLSVQVCFVWMLFRQEATSRSNGLKGGGAGGVPSRNGLLPRNSEIADPPNTIGTLCPTCPTCPVNAAQSNGVATSVPDVRKAAPVMFRMTITVFTYNRLNGLKVLLRSLVDADYLGRSDITLRIFLDFPKKADMKLDGTRAFLDTFHWPHGPYHLHRRLGNHGLKKTIMESWYPTADDEVAAFFEDDIEVSLVWFKWVDTAIRSYGLRDPKMLGLSLYRPIRDELSGKDVLNPTEDFTPYVLQQPCSWGAVYFPKPWRVFRNWYDANSNISPTLFDPSNPSINPSSNTWPSGSSWKKYLIKVMYDEGWFMVYPHFPDRMVLSTNHLLPGVHNLPPRKLFELPLVPPEAQLSEGHRRALSAFPPLKSMKAFDVMYKHVGNLDRLHGYVAPG